MNTYTRKSGKVQIPAEKPETKTANANQEDGVRVNGYEQVLAMLKVADPEFRESLLRRLATRDKQLAASLRTTLASL